MRARMNGCVSNLSRSCDCHRVYDTVLIWPQVLAPHTLCSSHTIQPGAPETHRGHLHREGASVGWKRIASVVLKKLITRSSSFPLS